MLLLDEHAGCGVSIRGARSSRRYSTTGFGAPVVE
jgi:hypothetical protein